MGRERHPRRGRPCAPAFGSARPGPRTASRRRRARRRRARGAGDGPVGPTAGRRRCRAARVPGCGRWRRATRGRRRGPSRGPTAIPRRPAAGWTQDRGIAARRRGRRAGPPDLRHDGRGVVRPDRPRGPRRAGHAGGGACPPAPAPGGGRARPRAGPRRPPAAGHRRPARPRRARPNAGGARPARLRLPGDAACGGTGPSTTGSAPRSRPSRTGTAGAATGSRGGWRTSRARRCARPAKRRSTPPDARRRWRPMRIWSRGRPGDGRAPRRTCIIPAVPLPAAARSSSAPSPAAGSIAMGRRGVVGNAHDIALGRHPPYRRSPAAPPADRGGGHGRMAGLTDIQP